MRTFVISNARKGKRKINALQTLCIKSFISQVITVHPDTLWRFLSVYETSKQRLIQFDVIDALSAGSLASLIFLKPAVASFVAIIKMGIVLKRPRHLLRKYGLSLARHKPLNNPSCKESNSN